MSTRPFSRAQVKSSGTERCEDQHTVKHRTCRWRCEDQWDLNIDCSRTAAKREKTAVVKHRMTTANTKGVPSCLTSEALALICVHSIYFEFLLGRLKLTFLSSALGVCSKSGVSIGAQKDEKGPTANGKSPTTSLRWTHFVARPWTA